MFNIDSFTIIGCGMLGSAIAYSLILRSLDNNIKRIFLIDDDILEIKNLPYLFLTDRLHQHIYKPKVFVLKDILYYLNPNIEIISYPFKYPFKEHIYNIESLYNSYIIDCRDSKSVDSNCDIKVNIDGHWGFVMINPTNVIIDTESRYTIKNSRYYSMIMANICIRIMKGYLLLEKDKYIINLRKEKFYDLPEPRNTTK